MVACMTEKENTLRKCAFMILQDQCPPDRKHYLCMKQEDDNVFDCVHCWDNYLWGIVDGSIEFPKATKL